MMEWYNSPMSLPRHTLISFIAIAVLAGGFFFWRLGSNPLEKWDEAIHAQVTHEMLQSGDWLELTWNHEPYFRKPPLRFWLQGVVSAAFGENEWTIRFWSATAGVLTTMLIALWAWQATQKNTAMWFTTLAFLSGRYLFYHAFRTGETDGLLTFFSLLALWSYWRSWLKPRWLLLTAIALGLTFLTKFTAVGFAGAAILLHLLLTKRFRLYPIKVWLQTIGLGVLIVAPWILVQLAIRGGAFIQEYVNEDIITRASKNLYGFTAGPDWYWGIFLKRAFPLAAFAIPALVWSLGRLAKKRDQLVLLWVLFLVVTSAIVSINATKTDWYLLPVYPVLALIIGMWIPKWFSWPTRWPFVGLLCWGVFTFVRRLPSMVDRNGIGRWLVPEQYVGGWMNTTTRLVVALIAVGAVIGITVLARKRQWLWLWRTMVTALVLWIGCIALLGQKTEFTLTRGEPLLREARTVVQREKPATLYLENIFLDHEPTVLYYLGNEPGTKLQGAPKEIPKGALVLEGVKRDIPPLPGRILLRSVNFRLLQNAE